MPVKKLKDKKCKVCPDKFTPWNTLQQVCSPLCALIWARQKAEKKLKKELRDRKIKLKSLSEWIKDFQSPVFNKFIRLRDKDEPCISCGRSDHEIKDHFTGGKWDAGHYLSVGAYPVLRFEELNVHKQCKQCNRDKSGYVPAYRINLINKIGIEKVEWLEGPHDPKNYRINDIRDMITIYRAKIKELKNG